MRIRNILFSVLAIGAVMLLFVITYSYLPIENNQEYDRVVFIPGIRTNPEFLLFWKHYLAHHYPEADREFVEGNYNFERIDSVIDIQERSVDALTKPGKTLVIVHSYGALQIVAALQNNPEISKNVSSIIAMAPAFDPAVDVLQHSKDAIDFEFSAIDIPMKIICGSFDSTVPCSSTGFPGIENREWVISNHATFLVPQVIGGRKILK